ncbi:MAG: cadherin-like beta sandwich domain-containing protein, partial [Clostridiales bacterium]
VTLNNDSKGTTIEIKVVNDTNTRDCKIYSIKLVMEQAADLKDLVIADKAKHEIDLYASANSTKTVSFKGSNYDYYAAPTADTDCLYLTPELAKSDSKIFDVTVEYYKKGNVSETKGVWEVELADVSNKIIVTVAAEGYQDTVYNFSLKNAKGELEDLEVFSGDAVKSELDLFPGFAAATGDYVVFLPYSTKVEGVTIRGTVENKKTDLTINKVAKSSAKDSLATYIEIASGENEKVEIVAGSSTYTVDVYRADKKADSESALSILELYTNSASSTGNKVNLTTTSAVSADKKTYTAAVAATQDYVWVSTKSKDKTSFVMVNGLVVNEQTSKTASTKVALNKTGNTVITVVGMAEDCETMEEHVITVTKGTVDAYLSGLNLSNGAGTINYSPMFNKTTTYYCANLPYNNGTIYINPMVSTTGSTVMINGSTVNSGVQSSFNVNVGASTFDITVTSAAGTVQHYYLNVLRQAQTPSIKVSSQKLSVDGGSATALAAYNIDGFNYLKLRDVAKLLSGSAKQFNVGYDNFSRVVTISSGKTYVNVGGELVIPTKYRVAKPTNQTLSMDGSNVYPMAYNIDDNNYFLMRDMALLLNCNIQYNDSTRVISVTTGQAFSN